MTPSALIEYKKYFTNLIIILVDADESILKDRLLKRNDNTKEAFRRLKQDKIDFENIEKEVDFIFVNANDVSKSIKILYNFLEIKVNHI